MKNIKSSTLFFAVLSLGFHLMSCQSAQKEKALAAVATAETKEVKVSMVSLKAEFDELMPLLVQLKTFQDPQNHEKIKGHLENLSMISEKVSHLPMMTKKDPTLQVLSTGLKDDIKRSQEAFLAGRMEYSRSNLLSSASYCIECHTRTNSGPSFATDNLNQALGSAGAYNKAQYLAATRQFDAAIHELETVIQAKSSGNVFEIDRAVRMALAISVRFQDDIKKSEDLVGQVLSSESVPFYLKNSARVWKKSVERWKKTPKKSKLSAIAQVEQLISIARAQQELNDERAGMIEMLRAQSLLRQILQVETKPLVLSEAMYYMGVATESMHDITTWSLHEDYFESCIRKAPHSAWSAKCYHSLEQSLFMGYTGSAGTSLPREEVERLSVLRQLAL